MPLMLIKMLLGGMLKRLWSLVTALFSLIARYPWQAVVIVLLAVLWWQNGALNGVRKDLAAMEVARDAEIAAHAQTVVNYHEAAKLAENAARANVKRVLKEQEQINEKHVAILESKWIANQSRADRLRHQSEAYSRSASEAGMSAAMEAACQAHAGTSCERISTLLKAAQDNTDQLIQLQKAALDQEGIEVNP